VELTRLIAACEPFHVLIIFLRKQERRKASNVLINSRALELD